MANTKTRSVLYSLAETFAYGKNLAREALNVTFRHPDTRRWKMVPDDAPGQSLITFFNECSKWTDLDWLSAKNWRRVENVLSEVIFPDEYRRLKTEFRLKGFRACILGEEMLEFIRQNSFAWKSEITNSETLAPEIQSSIDLLEMMIKESLVEASLRKESIQQLTQLCQQYHQIPKALELDGLSFSEEKRIGCGGSADIIIADLYGEKVVVKVLLAYKAFRADMIDKKWSPLHEEALNWIGLDLPGVNPFLGITLKHPRGIDLVFKFQELGNSVKYLLNNDVERMSFVQSKASGLVGAVHYLHQMGLVHADIKGENILVDGNESLVLTDFGLMLRTPLQSPVDTPSSMTSCSSSATSSGNYTLRFSSKERVFEGYRSEKDDIWAIGMTLIQLLTGEVPFINKYQNDAQLVLALAGSELELRDAQLPESVPAELIQVINRCIVPRPEDRPSTFELYSIMGQVAGKLALKDNMKEEYS